jgi:hypothetical protein
MPAVKIVAAAAAAMVAIAACAALPAAAAAQHVSAPEPRPVGAGDTLGLRFGAHAVPLLTRVSPIDQGSALTELYLTQPSLFGAAALFDGRLQARVTISLEPLTLERGELGAGVYGEGYVDRRHPHTYAHELMLTGSGRIGPVAASMSAGRGFVPFGTDDPMMRPFVKFPGNHHLGQILERLVAIGALRAGPVALEAAVFAGAEPMSTTELGATDRFADSWAARVTMHPAAGIELQASHAWVVSPEMPRGEGLDQRKWSASARLDRRVSGHAVYALAEWKRSTEVLDGSDLFSFGSRLAEVAVERGSWRPALRVEVTERPEEERGFDRFRAPWPHAHVHFLGLTRWTIAAARVERGVAWRRVTVAPFLEVSRSAVRETSGAGIFDPAQFYGSTRIWTFNAGARMAAGWHAPRMGRYGAASAVAAPTHSH